MSKLLPKKTSSLELMTNSGVIYALPKRYEQDLFDNSIPIVLENLREMENVIPEESDLIFIPVPDKLTMVDSTSYNAFSNFIEHINDYYECRKIFKTPMALEDLNSVYQKDDTHFNEGGIEKYARAILTDN